MSTGMTITWLQDDTVRVQAVTQDFDETLYAPDSHEIKIYDSTGTCRGTVTNPTAVAVGTYTYDYTIPAAGPAGIWKISWKIMSGAYPAREIINFLVTEG